MAKTVYKSIPAQDRTGPGVQCTTKTGEKYIISQNLTPSSQKKRVTLWHVLADGFEKIDSATAPTTLYSKIPGYPKE